MQNWLQTERRLVLWWLEAQMLLKVNIALSQ
jgi:hypothetical protein